ncbi:hypothetical protein GGR57DRAFT_449874 [Xylariaceae sp. FL1272]|nr:hypothetical protein GGR57DRAFT_449874 [Xylariaceae sp. FL1272]
MLSLCDEAHTNAVFNKASALKLGFLASSLRLRLILRTNTISSCLLVKVDYSSVQRETDRPRTNVFNTSFHTADEAPGLERPSDLPYSFKRWLPLIMDSRKLPMSSAQKIAFSRAEARLLLNAAEGSIQSGTVNRMYAEDLEEEILPMLRRLEFPPEGLFMRLNACSAKDGVQQVPGRSSLHSAEEVVLLLVTSTRARNALANDLDRGTGSFELYFLPFDEQMSSASEYRVFCPPRGHRISAISQYQWHKPWKFAECAEGEHRKILRQILNGCEDIRKLILGELDAKDETDMLLLDQGFSFDVLFEDSGCCKLVELNVFGVRSGCGSCLFQWINDRDVLYGAVHDEVEFRVTMWQSSR